MTTTDKNQPPTMQRQIRLPLTKAMEIAWKNIRLRLGRSLLVTSGIVLALAFLISIQTTESITVSLRNWIRDVPDSVAFDRLRSDLAQLTERIEPMATELRELSHGVKLPAGVEPFNAGKQLGATLPELQAELGELPGNIEEVKAMLTVMPETIGKFQNWLAAARQLKTVRDRFTAPQRLESALKQNGVPTTADEIASNRMQTRWLLALALLVAFVGILNAMIMSVTERFREIGTMKCLGALDGFIIKLFLIESLLQGIVGTVIGLALGLSASLLSIAVSYGSVAWRLVPWTELGQNALFCFLIGVGLTVAGALYPAWQAAKMEPIAAMRIET